MGKPIICAVILGICIVAIGLAGRPNYERRIVAQAREIARGDLMCFFDGHFANGDSPAVQLIVPPTRLVEIKQDLQNRFNYRKQANPFHFGIIVLRDPESDNPTSEVWGWSYFRGEFWRTGTDYLTSFDYAGDPIQDCLEMQE